MRAFPRTEVEGISLPRILIGSNWILGFSHTSVSADIMIRRRFSTKESVSRLLEAYLRYDIDAIMAPFYNNDILVAGIKAAEDRTSKKIIMIDTPIIDVADSKASRDKARKVIEAGRKAGSEFCLIHHSCAELLVDKLNRRINRLPHYTEMIRDCGMVPGLSAHMPELVQYSDENEYDIQTYVQLYNPIGFLMQIEVEGINRIIWNARKPVMAIKTMAAGRVSPFVGITFALSTLRPCDMITIGAHTPDEVHEDVEIAFAALERRPPAVEGRNSPNKTSLLGGSE